MVLIKQEGHAVGALGQGHGLHGDDHDHGHDLFQEEGQDQGQDQDQDQGQDQGQDQDQVEDEENIFGPSAGKRSRAGRRRR